MTPSRLSRLLQRHSLLEITLLAHRYGFGLSVGGVENDTFLTDPSFFVAKVAHGRMSNARRPRASRGLTKARRGTTRARRGARPPAGEAENASFGGRLWTVVVGEGGGAERDARVARRGGDVEVGVGPELEEEVAGVDEEEDERDTAREAEYGVVLRNNSVSKRERRGERAKGMKGKRR